MTPHNVLSGRSCKIGKVAGLIFVGMFSAFSCLAAPLTYTVSAPITYLDDPNFGLLGGARLGDRFTVSWTYDPDILPSQGDGTIFLSPKSATFATVSLGKVKYTFDEYFSLGLEPHASVEVGIPGGSETWAGDIAEIWVQGPPRSAEDPIGRATFARLVFPDGSFDGSPKLPDFAPTYAFLSLGVENAEGHVNLLSITTGQATITPVPEASTYGLIGSLALVALVVRRFKITQRATC